MPNYIYNPALERLRKDAEKRLYQKRLEVQERYKMRSLLDPLLNQKGREKLGGDNWFDTTIKGYQQLFDSNYLEWFRSPGQALINNLQTIGTTLDYAANLVKAPILAVATGDNVEDRLLDAYGLGDNGRIDQNMSELREVIGAPAAGVIGGTAMGALIGARIGGPLGALAGAGIGLVTGTIAGIAGENGFELGNTITDIALEYVVDPANIADGISGAIKTGAVKAAGSIDDVVEAAYKTSEDSIKAFGKGLKSNITSSEAMDYALLRIKQVSTQEGIKNPSKVFKRLKNEFITSYFEGDYKAFQKVAAELNMFPDIHGKQMKHMFNILKNDANVSRAYKVLHFIDSFDTKVAGTLVKATPMGLTGMGLKKVVSTIKLNNTATKLSKEYGKLLPDEEVPSDNLVKSLQDEGIIKSFDDINKMDNAQRQAYYKELKEASVKYAEAGDEAKAGILRQASRNVEFSNGVVKITQNRVNSKLNRLVGLFYKHQGDIDKVISDSEFEDAYKVIANSLYFPEGVDMLKEYLQGFNYNPKIMKLLRKMENTDGYLKYISSTGNTGSHTILADILSKASHKFVDDDPSKQYKKVIDELAQKVEKQTEGVRGAQVLMQKHRDKLMDALNKKFEKDILSVNGDAYEVRRLQHYKAIDKIYKQNFDIDKNLLEPSDAHMLSTVKRYRTMYINKRAQLINDTSSFMDFVRVAKYGTDGYMIDTTTSAVDVLPESVTKARSALEAIKYQTVEAINQYINKVEAGEKVNIDDFIKDPELVNSIKQAVININTKEFDIEDVELGVMSGKQAYAASLYTMVKTMRKAMVDPKSDYLKEVETAYNKQLEFVRKHNANYDLVINNLDAIRDNISTGRVASNNIHLLMHKEVQEVISDLEKLIGKPFKMDPNNINSYFASVKSYLSAAFNTDMPLYNNIVYSRSLSALNRHKETIRKEYLEIWKDNEMPSDIIDLIESTFESYANMSETITDYIKNKSKSTKYPDGTFKLEKFSNGEEIVWYKDNPEPARAVVYLNINGKSFPYYCSSGTVKKDGIIAGHWYPFFGIYVGSPNSYPTWFNKGHSSDMAKYYKSTAWEEGAKYLDSTLGDVRGNVKVNTMTPEDINKINTGLSPVPWEFTDKADEIDKRKYGEILKNFRLQSANLLPNKVPDNKSVDTSKLNQAITEFNNSAKLLDKYVTPYSTYQYMANVFGSDGLSSPEFKEHAKGILQTIEALDNNKNANPIVKNSIRQLFVRGLKDQLFDSFDNLYKPYLYIKTGTTQKVIKGMIYDESQNKLLKQSKNISDIITRAFENPKMLCEMMNNVAGINKISKLFDRLAKVNNNSDDMFKAFSKLKIELDIFETDLFAFYKYIMEDYTKYINGDFLIGDIKYFSERYYNDLFINLQNQLNVVSDSFDKFENKLLDNLQDSVFDSVKLKEFINRAKDFDNTGITDIAKIANISGVSGQTAKYYSTLNPIELFEFSDVDLHSVNVVLAGQEDSVARGYKTSDLESLGINTMFNKMINMDIETTVTGIEKRIKESSDVVQIAFNNRNNSYNFLALNTNYDTYGKENLLDPLLIRGEYLKQQNELAYNDLINGKVDFADFNYNGKLQRIYKDSNTMFDYYNEAINKFVDLNGYLTVLGQNATKFDTPIILKGLNEARIRAGQEPIKGIVTVDTLGMIRAIQGVGHYAKHKSSINSFEQFAYDLSEVQGAKLEDIYLQLVDKGYINHTADIVAHNAASDIRMTQAIFDVIYEYTGGTSLSVGTFKNHLQEVTNGFYEDTCTTIKNNIKNLNKLFGQMSSQDHEFFYNKFADAIKTLSEVNTNYVDTEQFYKLLKIIDQATSELLDIMSYVDISDIGTDSFAKELSDVLENTQGMIEDLIVRREEIMKSVYGTSLVQAQQNLNLNTAKLMDNYHTFRNHPMFTNLMSIHKGDINDPNMFRDYSIENIFTHYRNSFNNFNDIHPEYNKFYDYTERIDAYALFSDTMYKYLNDALSSAKDASVSQALKQSFSRIQTKLVGSGVRKENRSIDTLIKDAINDCKKLTPDISKWNNAVKNELKIAKANILMKLDDISDDINAIDSSGEMMKTIINYIEDCFNNISKYNLLNREGRDLHILNPVPDKHYLTSFRNLYSQVIDYFTKDPKTVYLQEGQTYTKTVSEWRDTYEDFMKLVETGRKPLSEIRTINKEYRTAGILPEGYVTEQYQRDLWNINDSMHTIAYKHTKQDAEHYSFTRMREHIMKQHKIEYKQNVEKDLVTYRNAESKAVESIRNIMEDSQIWDNEFYDILRRLSPENGYNQPKIDVFSSMYESSLKDNKVYQDFVDNMYASLTSQFTTDELADVTKTNAIRKHLEAVAMYTYLSKEMDVENVNRAINLATEMTPKYIQCAKTFKESINAIKDKFNGNYEAMFEYIDAIPYMNLYVMHSSSKYINKEVLETTGKLNYVHELHELKLSSPAQLKELFESNRTDISIGFIDKNTAMELKSSLGHKASNRYYKSAMLNKLVNIRNAVMEYVVRAMKVTGLWNIGFTVTNTLEGALKTFISTTGNRLDTARQYGNAVRMYNNWSRLNMNIAKAVQGSPYYMMKDQLKLLELEKLIGDSLFKNGKLNDINTFITEAQMNGVPKYMISNIVKSINKNTFNEANYLSRYLRVKDVYDTLGEYNLDEFNVVADFIDRAAAASEFQKLKKSSELNITGRDENDNAVQRALKKFLFSNNYLGENNPLRYVTPYTNLSLNSSIETINRFALQLDLVEKGFSKNEALNRVLATHFNYADKSQTELWLELLYPFISFPLRSFNYWYDVLDKNPQMIEIFIDMMMSNWGDEAQNIYNQSQITKGSLRIFGDTAIESGISMFDAMAFGGNALNVLNQRKLNPAISVMIEGAKQLTTGQSQLDYRFKRMPLISHVNTGVDLIGKLASKSKIGVYDYFPSVFNEVYKNNRYYYNTQGKYAYMSAYSRLYYANGQARAKSKNVAARTRYLV